MTNPNKWNAVLDILPATEYQKETFFRLAGDNSIMVEYGLEPVVDYMDMFRIQAVYQRIINWQAQGYSSLEGFITALPQWRTIQYTFDPKKMSLEKMLYIAKEIELAVGDNRNIAKMEFNSPIIQMPFCWEHSDIKVTIEKYLRELGRDVLCCDSKRFSNIPFIAKYNGLSEDEVKEKFFGTDYLAYTMCFLVGLVMAVALDRRSMLLTAKYNPTRTWTARNIQGLGGFDIGDYPVAAPGGYQLVGSHTPVLQFEQKHPDFKKDVALLHTLDRIRFVEVSESEQKRITQLIDEGSPEFRYKITPATFSVAEWIEFEQKNAKEISAHQKHIYEAAESSPVA